MTASRTRAPLARVVLLVACVAAAAPAAAQDRPAAPGPGAAASPVVDDVLVEREGRIVTDETLTSLIETVAGAPLSMRLVRETIAHLVNLNAFEDVQVMQEASARGGIRLRYVLVPSHPVDRLVFVGRLGLSEGDLRRVIRDQVGDVPRATQAPAIVASLQAAYRDRGYPAAAVTTRVDERHDPDRATMIVEIDAGPRPVVLDVRLAQTDADEQGLLVDRPDIRTGTPYDKAEVDRSLQRWTDRMHERGYYEARASHGVLFAPDAAVVSVTVTRGPKVTVAFAGDPLPASDRERLVTIRAESSADEDLLEDSARAIETFLRGRGYRDARAAYERTPGVGELTITFTVTRGPRYTVGEVAVRGASIMGDAEVRQLLGAKEGEPFTAAALGMGVAAVRGAYLSRGFTQVQVQPTESVVAPGNAADPNRQVNVTLQISEGLRTVIRTVSFEGQTALTEGTVRGFVQLTPGRPYTDRDVAVDRDRTELEYRNRGYESVAVRFEVARLENDTQADVRFIITEGPQILVDRVVIVGNTRTSATTIQRELLLRPGQPLGYSNLIESRSRLVALGLFRRVTIEELPHVGEPRRDVFVRIEEAPPTVIGGGGGVEGAFRLRTDESGQAVERFELAPRGFFQIGRRNLWGKNRAVDLFTRVSLRSRDAVAAPAGGPVTPAQTQGGYGFNEYRVVGTFREPRVLGSRTDVLLTGIFEQAIRSSFNFLRREARAEAGLQVSRLYSVSGRYSFQRTELFDEKFTEADQPLIDRLFPQVRLSTISGSVIRDSRDDILDASKGTLVVADSSLAARGIGSEVGFVKTYLQGRTFFRVPIERRTVVALAARLGAAHGFPREVPQPASADGGTPAPLVVQDLPASERFFAGGDTTVRGFALDRLGDASTISATGFPLGGNGVIVLNAELRVAAVGPLQAVGFLDAGNVVARAGDLSLVHLRSAAGFGIRYRSPVGPIRLDLGFKLDRRELAPGRQERRSVWHISLGQAF